MTPESLTFLRSLLDTPGPSALESAPGVLAAGVVEFPNGRLVSRSIDNRIGAYVVLEAARIYAKGPGNKAAAVTAVATTREEIASTGGGARSSATTLEPDVAIVVDVT